MANISFRPLCLDDMSLLHNWLNQSHMRAFYQKAPITLEQVTEKFTPRVLGQVPTYSHIVSLEDIPIGKIQCYHLSDYPDYAKVIGTSDGISVDLFIGDPNFLGKGLGNKMLSSYLQDVAFPKFPIVNKCYICHETSNIVALSCSKKVGFKFLRDVVEDGEPCELLVYELNKGLEGKK